MAVMGVLISQGGTHQSAFKEHMARTIKEYFNMVQEKALLPYMADTVLPYSLVPGILSE